MYKLFIYFQILFILGLPFAIGLQRTYEFAFQLHNVQAICIFMAGIFIVLIRWPVIGMFVEIIGFFLLLRYVLVLHLRVRVVGWGWW